MFLKQRYIICFKSMISKKQINKSEKVEKTNGPNVTLVVPEYSVKSVNISLRFLGLEGIQTLNQQTSTALNELVLSQSKIGAFDAGLLSSNKIWTNLRLLDLSHNNIGDEGAAAISANTYWTALEEVNMKKKNAKS